MRNGVRWPLVGFFGVIALGVASLVLIAVSANGKPAHNRFAGYIWIGNQVDSVSGSWTLPSVIPYSQPGYASTWIGATDPSTGSTATDPFIQIGVNEEVIGSVGGATSTSFSAFWSDTQEGFHPQFLLQVHPGDHITASMRLVDGSWMLQIRDETRGTSRSLSTRQEASASFSQAEWTQEDVTDGRDNEPFPYPDLSPTRFSDLAVDGARPAPNLMAEDVLTLPHGSISPTALRDNRFSVAASGR